MNVKKTIHDLFFKNKKTKTLYCIASYLKGRIYYGFTLVLPIIKYKVLNKQPVFLIFTPEHANLGDHAIAYSEQKIFNKLGIKYYEVTGRQLYILQQYGYLKILNNAVVFLNGGGNLGTLWPDIERMNRLIISTIKRSTICIMPNSIYYGEDDEGKIEFKKSIEIYNQHPRLYIYARESISYKIMKCSYRNVKLMPDMLLALNKCDSPVTRKGCIFCMRDDIERTLSYEERNVLYDKAKTIFGDIHISNTVLDYNVSVSNRNSELESKFDEFRKTELVVTDRLHGMIFCAITGTKCIVLNGRSPKISGCFQWIEKLDYITLIENLEEFEEAYYNMPQYPTYCMSEEMKMMFQELEKDIVNLIVLGKW